MSGVSINQSYLFLFDLLLICCAEAFSQPSVLLQGELLSVEKGVQGLPVPTYWKKHWKL